MDREKGIEGEMDGEGMGREGEGREEYCARAQNKFCFWPWRRLHLVATVECQGRAS